MRDAFRVVTPGPYLTVQDQGRFGYQKMGIPISGALDFFSFTVANHLVGNPLESALFEITILGPHLEVLSEMDVALTGAEMEMSVNSIPVERWSSIRVKSGDILTIGQARSGCRGYLAVSGGIEVSHVMGSRSTYVGGELGGYEGRPLKKGDLIRCGKKKVLDRPRHLSESAIPRYPQEILLKAIPGPQDDFFDEGSALFFTSPFLVTPKADRMGYRLKGPLIPLKSGVPKSIISEPAMPGAVQIPADQQPIILLLEQTVGGYAKIATVVTPDISKIAQATPGDTIRFESVSLEIAHELFREDHQRRLKIINTLSGL
ncbi:MAG: biotin-dependent carboxyltransferase family protein [Thermodesulfobacteriota bacterium]